MGIEAALQIEAALIRRQAPDLLMREGQTFAARVAERSGQRGIIVLAGSPLVAELPDSVQTGDKLRLLVAETRGEKVLMKLVPEQAAQAPPQATITIPLPGGGQVHVSVDPDASNGGGEGSDAENASIALSYDSPELGTVGLRLALAPGALTVVADAPIGRAYDIADDASDALRRRLETMTGRVTQVSVLARHDSIDAYA